MSLASEIVQLFGTGSVPVIVGGTVLGVFELGARFASQRAKDALSKWLLSFDVQKARALPDGTQELFERIFGERHFSLKCLVRSAAFSVGTTLLIALLVLLIWPHEFAEMTRSFFTVGYFPGDWLLTSLWLPWNIVMDYVSLLKTRLILHILTNVRHSVVSLVIGCIDYLIYNVLFIISIQLLLVLPQLLLHGWPSIVPSPYALTDQRDASPLRAPARKRFDRRDCRLRAQSP